jgi:transmembrane sensor
MKWLESPRNDAERLLREGLDLAVQRTGDEITHRRVWARIGDATEAPPLRSYRGLVVSGAALVLLGTAGVLAYSHLHGKAPVAVVAGNPTLPAAPGNRVAGNVAGSDSTPSKEAAIAEAEHAPGHYVRTGPGERARVALGGGAEANLDESSALTWDSQHRPSIERGSARMSVPHQPPGWRFSVTAGPYVVTVVGTKFDVRVASRTVGVDVSEGIVEVWRGTHSTRLVAGDSWHGPLYPEESLPAQPSLAPTSTVDNSPPVTPARGKPAVQTNQSLLDAQSALQAGNFSRAVEILTRTAQGSGPAAENAAYELGRIARYNLNHPRQAVALWDKYRIRFPSGLLRTEADLSIVETLSHMGDVRAALAEADAFVTRHPDSERRLDVQRLAERLRAAEAAADSR